MTRTQTKKESINSTSVADSEPLTGPQRLVPYFKKFLNYALVVTAIFTLYKIGVVLYDKKTTYDISKKETACPTLLSIARSARDTLLVMKAEELCTIYVLDNIN